VTLAWEQVVVDARDPRALGAWWAAALRWVVVALHLDPRPDEGDAEIAPLMGLGATAADVAQGQRAWVVPADPERDGFCVPRARA